MRMPRLGNFRVRRRLRPALAVLVVMAAGVSSGRGEGHALRNVNYRSAIQAAGRNAETGESVQFTGKIELRVQTDDAGNVAIENHWFAVRAAGTDTGNPYHATGAETHRFTAEESGAYRYQTTFRLISDGPEPDLHGRAEVVVTREGDEYTARVESVSLQPESVESGPRQSIGMVADNTTKSVTLFDPETDEVLGTVYLPQNRGSSSATGDVAISPDRTLGFVTDFRFRVWVIDLTTERPTLAAGTNPIPIRNSGEDLDFTADGKYLAVTDGSNFQPLSIIDVAQRREVQTYYVGHPCASVATVDDGSYLVTAPGPAGRLTRVVPQGSGDPVNQLSLSVAAAPASIDLSSAQARATGTTVQSVTSRSHETQQPGSISLPWAFNVSAPSGGRVAVVVTQRWNSDYGEVRTFALPDLTPVDMAIPTASKPFAFCAAIHPRGDRVYVRSNGEAGQGSIDVFALDPQTGALGDQPLRSISVPNHDIPGGAVFYGMDQIALSADGSKLYAAQRTGQTGKVNVYDADDLTLLGSIDWPNGIIFPTGIAVVGDPVLQVAIDIKPGDSENTINLKSKGALDVAVLSDENFDATTVDPATVTLAGAPVSQKGNGDYRTSTDDVNGDGRPDLLLRVETEALQLTADATEAVLEGETTEGRRIRGTDAVRIVGSGGRGNDS